MPQVADRRQLGTEELIEAPMTGPFGGVQSELPPTQVADLGFSSSDNIMFRLGRASLRPGFSTLPALPSNVLGFAEFYNISGMLTQVVFTSTGLYKYASGAFTQITGPSFAGTTQLFSWDVLNYKLCFSQGTDKVWVWDGVSSSYSQASTSAPVAKYLAEIGLHLFAIDPTTPQRYYWSGIGDPTDWTSFTSGLNDNVNNLGPINGILKLGQYGFGFHQFGIVQIVPTGIGLSPFFFYPIMSTPQSVVAPYSLQKYIDQGIEYAVYLGIDNVYVFNGTSVEPIGDRPLGDSRRVGARTRILQDVTSSNLYNIVGAITYQIAGNPYRAYWLMVPPNRVWVYNFDEGNWTRFVFSSAKTLVTMSVFSVQNVIRIMDLIGTIADQTWTPATLNPNNPFASFGLAFADGTTGYMDFTSKSEISGSLVSGQVTFGDKRHKHTIKKFRITFIDHGSVTPTITLTNELGVSQSFTFTLGTGSGQELSYVQGFNLSGLRFIWTLSLPAGSPGEFVEFSPMFDIGGEQRCGSLEN